MFAFHKHIKADNYRGQSESSLRCPSGRSGYRVTVNTIITVYDDDNNVQLTWIRLTSCYHESRLSRAERTWLYYVF